MNMITRNMINTHEKHESTGEPKPHENNKKHMNIKHDTHEKK